MANGIMLDLVNERTGDVASAKCFGNNSLFKLHSLQIPSLLETSIIKDVNYKILSDEDYALIKDLHNKHKSTTYNMRIFEDERIDALTFPNQSFTNNNGYQKFSLKLEYFESNGHVNREFSQRLDQRIAFQLYPKLVEARTPYDIKTFTFANLPAPNFRDSVQKNKNHGELENILSQLNLYPCLQANDSSTSKWIKMDKSEHSISLPIKYLHEDTIETYSVLNYKKLFDDTKVRWCADLYSGTNEKLSPVLKIGYDSTAEKYKFQYAISDSTLLRICVLRFFSRYRRTLSSTVVSNKTFYDKLTSHNQFSSSFYSKLSKAVADFGSKRGTIYKQRLNGGSHINPRDESNLQSLPVNLKFRLERCLTAYNQTSKEFVIQFMLLIEDPLAIFSDQLSPTATTSKTDQQTWFFSFMENSECFLSYKLKPLFSCKRRFFTIHLEDTNSKKDAGNMSSWTKDNAPLLHLHVKYTTTSAGHLRSIQIRFYNNIEYLGFSLYGNPEILYSIERFYTEYMKFYDEVVTTSENSHSFRAKYRGSNLTFFQGKLAKSLQIRVIPILCNAL